MPETLTVVMLAARIGVTRATIYNWIKDGRFNVPPIEGTKPRRWRKVDIDAWLNSTGATGNAI